MSLASYQGKPLITGSDKTNDDPKNAKTEIYDYQSDSWSDAPDYPYSARITYYATTSTSDSTYIIGDLFLTTEVAIYILIQEVKETTPTRQAPSVISLLSSKISNGPSLVD